MTDKKTVFSCFRFRPLKTFLQTFLITLGLFGGIHARAADDRFAGLPLNTGLVQAPVELAINPDTRAKRLIARQTDASDASTLIAATNQQLLANKNLFAKPVGSRAKGA
ncbi:MAG: hypothetical protein KDJ38_09400, partial [Gammaproteobacteria bacterium]|nr:hypothetical protein [Gammaproteobacteria bacterium]